MIAALVAVWAIATISTAEANSRYSRSGSRSFATAHSYRFHNFGRYARHGSLRHWASVLQCVPFARDNSGIELTGNAKTWWDHAEGLYARGAKPEVGSILNFRASSRMRMGHVAVVTNVINSRHIEIDHANWSRPGRISRAIDVVDVSATNDWTEVRVAIGDSEEDFGAIYPTYGFIYDRPDNGVMIANSGVGTRVASAASTQDQPQLAALSTAPEEVAEAEDDMEPKAYSYRHRFGRHHASARWRQRGHFAGRASVYRVSSHNPIAATHHRRRF